MQDRVELFTLANADEEQLSSACITDWLPPHFKF